MRTTLDLPDALYRALKIRAATSGTTLRDLASQLLEQGLREPGAGLPPTPGRRQPPPVIASLVGVPVPALTPAEFRRMEEEQDEAAYARSTRR